jgi:hypothetical protein
MPDFKITIDDLEVKQILTGLDGENLRQALEDAGQIIMESTKAGYLREKAPDGKAWSPNPSWYKTMKRGAATLTGPTSKALGGPLTGKYEFAQINLKRMKNALTKKVNMTRKEVVVKYSRDVERRAEITQLGGEGQMILSSTSGGGTINMSVNVQARPHLGVADNWERLGFKTDVQHILDAFEGTVDKHFE